MAGLVGRLGGRIEVMSKVDQGTTFWVYLPETTEADSIKIKAALGDVPASALSEVVRVRRSA